MWTSGGVDRLLFFFSSSSSSLSLSLSFSPTHNSQIDFLLPVGLFAVLEAAWMESLSHRRTTRGSIESWKRWSETFQVFTRSTYCLSLLLLLLVCHIQKCYWMLFHRFSLFFDIFVWRSLTNFASHEKVWRRKSHQKGSAVEWSALFLHKNQTEHWRASGLSLILKMKHVFFSSIGSCQLWRFFSPFICRFGFPYL